LCLSNLKNEHCSHQYRDGHVFISIDCCRYRHVSWNFYLIIFIPLNFFNFILCIFSLLELHCDLMNFTQHTFKFKSLLRYKSYRLPTVISGGMFLYSQLNILVIVRLIELHIGVIVVQSLKSSVYWNNTVILVSNVEVYIKENLFYFTISFNVNDNMWVHVLVEISRSVSGYSNL
jgi:hypothetical protein